MPAASLSARTRGRRRPGRPAATRAAPRRAPRRRRGCGRRRGRSAGCSATSSRRPRDASGSAATSRPARVELAEERLGGGAARAKLRRWKGPARAQLAARRRGPRARGQVAPALGAAASASAATSGRERPRTSVVRVAQDGELLGRDLHLGLAQPLGVVEPDRGQHSDLRGDRVGRVEAAAEARPRSPPTSTRAAAKATKAAAVATSNWVTASPSSSARLTTSSAASATRSAAAANSAGVDLGAAIRIRSDQRAVCGETQAPVRSAVRLEQRRGHPRHRGLAVGADDVDRGEAVLGHAERRVEPVHPLEPELPADRLERVEVGLGQAGSSRAPRVRAR